jgi:endonuclease YncB( thermonuclease family)
MLRFVALLSVFVTVTVTAGWAAPPAGLVAGERVAVADVIDGDTVVLDRAVDGGKQVRLVGLQAPKLPLGRAGFRTWPLADEAKAAVQSLVNGHAVTLYYGGARKDRHGRHLAHLVRDDGLWVQGEMLARGLARVYSFADNRSAVAEMLAIEAEARAARRGIWALPFYALLAPEQANGRIDTFQIVEGKVLTAARVNGRTYLNFGADWRTDFTVTVDAAADRLFRRQGTDPLTFEGRRVRVRGWLGRYNGPTIEASHPEQIEVLDGP